MNGEEEEASSHRRTSRELERAVRGLKRNALKREEMTPMLEEGWC